MDLVTSPKTIYFNLVEKMEKYKETARKIRLCINLACVAQTVSLKRRMERCLKT